jgi:serine/threonine-protein kinase
MAISTSNALEQLVAPGTVVNGKYRVERVIGVGGMGIVVEAWHLDFDERVAIKFLSPTLGANQEAVARFEREARVLFKIKSPHVCRVLDIGRLESGSPYLVLEFLEGEDLAVRLTHRTASGVRDSVDWIVQACDAVAEAHARGIVHRDIKPENLYLARSADGNARIKVLDFGLSKIAAPQGADRQRTLTATEQAMGTPHYMSPEQWMSARDVGTATDQWSLAVILYELLCGLPPFDGEQLPQVCTAVLHASMPALVPRAPGVPPEIEVAIRRALEKEPGSRFPNLGGFAKAIAPFGRSESRAIADRIVRMFEQAESLLQSAELARLSASSLAAIRASLPGAAVPSPTSSRAGAAVPSPVSSRAGRAALEPSGGPPSDVSPSEPASSVSPSAELAPANAKGSSGDVPSVTESTAGLEAVRLSEPSSVELDLERDAIIEEPRPRPLPLPKTTVERKAVPKTAALPFVSPEKAAQLVDGDAAAPSLRKRSQTAQSWQRHGSDRPSRSEPSARKVGLISFGVALAILGLVGFLAGPRMVAAVRGTELNAASVSAVTSPPSLSASEASPPAGRPDAEPDARTGTSALAAESPASVASVVPVASSAPLASASTSARPPKAPPPPKAHPEAPTIRPPLPVPPKAPPVPRPKTGGSIFDDR